jgi:sugar O-acyltransferase (sialic acid O-acetyltransferase NeuD family)
MPKLNIILIGYSGHAYVAYSIFESNKQKVVGYCDFEEKSNNPYNLTYFGTENSEKGQLAIQSNGYFIAVGDNKIRRKVLESLLNKHMLLPINAIHKQSTIAKGVQLGKGVMIGAGVIINPQSIIGNGVICNTGCIIEHENIIGDFAHIGPGVVLCGNVKIGENTFVGANTVVKQGITIGKNVMIGAGSVVLKDVTDHTTLVGNPAKEIKTK